MITGGGAMHLNDAFGRAAGLRTIFTHHEQAAAMAAESYGRASGRLAAVNVTTGPGGVNALNGVYGAYVDSIGMVVISGQVKRETTVGAYSLPLRQLGDQEVDIIPMVRGITKYAVTLDNPADAKRVIEKAIAIARRGRPGPVWIDIPGDIQGAMVDPDALLGYDPATDTGDDEAPNTARELGALKGPALSAEVDALLDEIATAERPVVLVGSGVRLSETRPEFLEFIERLGVPVVTAWNAHDLVANANPLYVGRPGSVGDRAGNFAVQNADYLLVLGCRLNIRQISYNWQSFARNAAVAMVEIDRTELDKPTLSLHRPIHADLRDFFEAALRAPRPETNRAHGQYLAWCRTRAERYPVVQDEYRTRTGPVNPYVFAEALFAELDADDIVVTGDGSACVITFQCADIKAGQQLYTNSGSASMGYDLPAAIGAYYATGAKRIICLAGDGSIMMNLQELQTIAGNRLPIKIFVLNNDGYLSIRQSQEVHFADNITGCDPASGVTFPDFQRVGAGFGLAVSRIHDHATLRAGIRNALETPGAILCEVMIDPAQQFSPKLQSRRLEDGTMVSPSLEDMAPFLPRDELASNMLVKQTAK
jgi:acetolactate synthase-1/2/3 large subunit